MKEVNILKDEIRRYFKRSTVAFLATADGTQPRVRPVSLIYCERAFWVATITSDAKMKQLRKNEKVELCYIINGRRKDRNKGYIRITGIARITRSKKERKKIAREIPFFKVFWQHTDDPSYTLLKIRVREVEYLRSEEFTAIRLPWKRSDTEYAKK